LIDAFQDHYRPSCNTNQRNNDYLGNQPGNSSGCDDQGYRRPKPIEPEARCNVQVYRTRHPGYQERKRGR
jgi:hypothetical protein